MNKDEVQVAVDRLAEQLHRSVVINDPAVHLQYTSPHFGDEDDVRIQAVLQRDAGSKAVGHVLSQGVATWTTAGVIPPNPEIGMKARVCVPVRWRGELLGLLMVMDADGTLTTAELADINAAAIDIAALMGAEGRSDEAIAAREQGVADLVDGDPVVRRRALADLVEDRHLGRFDHLVAIVLSITNDTPGSSAGVDDGGVGTPGSTPAASHIETALRNATKMRFSQTAAANLHAVLPSSAVLLLGSSTPLSADAVVMHAERMVDRTRDMSAGRFGCVAGVGANASGLDRAADSVRQGRLAARAAQGSAPGKVRCWSDLGALGALQLIPARDLTCDVLPEELQRLLTVDRDGLLAETLRAYLDHAGSGPDASNALHIHRTTLYYRLGRITDLTGLDLKDGRTRLALHLGLTMLNMIDTPFRH